MKVDFLNIAYSEKHETKNVLQMLYFICGHEFPAPDISLVSC